MALFEKLACRMAANISHPPMAKTASPQSVPNELDEVAHDDGMLLLESISKESWC